MATGILKVDGILPNKITAITADGTSYPLKKLSDSEGRVLWAVDLPIIVIAKTNWDGETKFNVNWKLDSITDDGDYKLNGEIADKNGAVRFTNSDVIKVLSFDTSELPILDNLFQLCGSLEYVDTSNWDTSNVTSMANMFQSCSSLQSLDVSRFNGVNTLSTGSMFYGCSNLRILDFSSFGDSKIMGMESMFRNCTNLVTLNMSNFRASNIKTMYLLFNGCAALEELDLSGFNIENVTSLSGVFSGCRSLTAIKGISHWNPSSAKDMGNMFAYCENLDTIDLSSWNTPNITTTSSMFNGCAKLSVIDVSNFDMSKVTSIASMFEGCKAMSSLNLENWNLASLTNMSRAFLDCWSLTSLSIANWNTSSVTSMGNVFAGCRELSSLDVSNWNVSQVTDMNSMFGLTLALKTIDVSKWKCRSLTNANQMFNSAGVTYLDLSGWEATNLVSTRMMFYYCGAKSIDLSSWDFTHITDYVNMFFQSRATDIYAYRCNQATIDILNSIKPAGAKLHTSFPAVMDGLTTRFDGHAQWYGVVKIGTKNNYVSSSYGTIVGSLPVDGIARPEGSFNGSFSSEFRPDTQDWTIEWVVQPKCYQYWNPANLTIVTSSSDNASKRLLTLDLEDTNPSNRGYPIVRIDGVLGGREFPSVGEALDLDTDRIYRISITYNEGNWSLYVDGELHASYMYAVDFSKDTNRIYMDGFLPFNLRNTFAYYSVNIYNRALSAQEIKQNYDKSYEDYGEYNYNITLPFEIL